jgi:hypothetical protein
LETAAAKAVASIESGSALDALTRLIDITNRAE